jgi:hypothetical protein
MVDKVIIRRKFSKIKSTVSEKKEDVNEKIKGIKELGKDQKNNVQDEPGKWRKLAPKIFV